MPRISPLPLSDNPEIRPALDNFFKSLGFVPNAALIMQRRESPQPDQHIGRDQRGKKKRNLTTKHVPAATGGRDRIGHDTLA